MHFEFAYLVVVGLLFLVGVFYLSPFELKVNDDDDDELNLNHFTMGNGRRITGSWNFFMGVVDCGRKIWRGYSESKWPRNVWASRACGRVGVPVSPVAVIEVTAVARSRRLLST